MLLQQLKPFQVDPNRVNKEEINTLAAKIQSSTKVSEIQQLFDRNISLCAFFLKIGYIKYHEIYFLSTSLIEDEFYRPDYICCCYHHKQGVSWYAIICAGAQDITWNDDLTLTNVGKTSFDRLNYTVSHLGQILVKNKLVDEIVQDRIYGLLIIGQDKEFFRNPRKQERKRDLNENTPLKIRTYGSFVRHLDRKNKQSWLMNPFNIFTAR